MSENMVSEIINKSIDKHLEVLKEEIVNDLSDNILTKSVQDLDIQMNIENFKKSLMTKLIEKEISLEQLSALIDVDYLTLHSFINDNLKDMPISILIKIALKLETSLNDLIQLK